MYIYKNSSRTQYSRRKMFIRYLVFFLGICINSFGIVLITKGMLGTSQISSLPYVVSLKFSNISFGLATFVMNVVFLIIQVGLMKWRVNFSHLLQLPVSLAFGVLIDISMNLTSFLNPISLISRLITLVVGCVILGLGISIEVSPKVVTVPGEGVVYAISNVKKIKFGTVKLFFDITMVISGIILSIIFFSKIKGIGIGTIVSAMLVGKVVNFFDDKLKNIYNVMHT